MNLMSDFRRNIEIGLEDASGDATLVSSVLTDRYHHIVLEVLVDNRTLQVRDVGVQFRKAPMPNCVNSSRSLKLMTGVSVGKGLTRKLFELLGGSTGCPNLRNMLLCSLPLLLNVLGAEGYSEVGEMMEALHGQFRGSCAGYE